MATDKELEKIESLKVVIYEQQRDCDYLLHIYNRTRATEGLLLTAVFAIIVYLYANPSSAKESIRTRLFFPTQDYGKVIYVLAAGFLGYGVIRLILVVFGDNPWETAYETPKNDYTHKHLDTLEYVKKRYDICHEFNSNAYIKRKKELIFLFYCILISAIVLIVIKTLT